MKTPRTRAQLLAHIMGNVVADEATGCWIWQRATSGGYGVVGAGELLPLTGHLTGCGRQMTVHKATYRLLVDDVIPEGYELHHRCFNKACCNPGHVQLVTDAEHGHLHRRPADEPCLRGHLAWTRRNGRRYCLACDKERQRRNRRAAAVRTVT